MTPETRETTRQRIIEAAERNTQRRHGPSATLLPTLQGDCVAAARKVLTIASERMTARVSPKLNTDTGWDALILVGTVLRELLTELVDAEPQATAIRNASPVPLTSGYMTPSAEPPQTPEPLAFLSGMTVEAREDFPRNAIGFEQNGRLVGGIVNLSPPLAPAVEPERTTNDDGAGLIHQAIPDMAGTEPRPSEDEDDMQFAFRMMREFLDRLDAEIQKQPSTVSATTIALSITQGVRAYVNQMSLIASERRCDRDMGDGYRCVLWKGHQAGCSGHRDAEATNATE